MTRSLFSREVGVALGEVFIDKEIEAKGIPDPMERLKVLEVDESGMVHLTPVWGMARRVVLSPDKLFAKYRKEAP